MTQKIKFGTDGWRGVIAEDYTFDNVRRAAQGFASYLLEQGYAGKWVIVGYDKRFHSENYRCAKVMVDNRLGWISCTICRECFPSPNVIITQPLLNGR